MLTDLISGGASFRQILLELIITVPIILISLTFHECAHGWVSYKCGDPTARNLGRLTLNPIKHIDPIGALCMLLCGFGWAKPVPVNSRYYKHPKWQMALVAAAGPITNLLLAFVSLLITNVITILPGFADSMLSIAEGSAGLKDNIAYIAYLFFWLMTQMNVYLAVFNLIPLPPLDGSRILFIFLPTRWYFKIMRYERYIQIILLVLLVTDVIVLPLSWISGRIIVGMEWLIGLIPIFR